MNNYLNNNLNIAIDGRIFFTTEFSFTTFSGLSARVISLLMQIKRSFPNVKLTFYFEPATPEEEIKAFLGDSELDYKFFELELSQNEDLFFTFNPFHVCSEYDPAFFYTKNIPISIYTEKIFELMHIDIMRRLTQQAQAYFFNTIEALKGSNCKILTSSNSTNDLLKTYIKNDIELIPYIETTTVTRQIVSQNEIELTLQKFNISSKFLLMTCKNEFGKNLNDIIASIIDFQNKSVDLTLVITGSLEDQWKSELKNFIQDRNYSKIIFTNYITDREMCCLYKSALALIHPVWSESNCHSILNAMALKCPIITTKIGDVPTLTDNYVEYFNPSNQNELQTAIQNVIYSTPSSKQKVEKAFSKAKENDLNELANQLVTNWTKQIAEFKQNDTSEQKLPPINNTHELKDIAIDARSFFNCFTLTRGIGLYCLNFIKALAKKYPNINFNLYLDPNSDFSLIKQELATSNIFYYFYSNQQKIHGDVFLILDPLTLAPQYNSPFRYVKYLPISTIVYDLTGLVMRQDHYEKWTHSTQIAYLTRLEMLKVSNSQVLSISENTKEDLIKYAKIPEEKIVTIMAGLNQSSSTVKSCNFTDIKTKYNITAPYFLTVGGLDPHKNFNFSFSSMIYYQELCRERNGVIPQLVIVGDKKVPQRSYFEKIVNENHLGNIIFTDYVTREELEILYNNATALLFPSLYEGFGFPVLEGMANKCPVITSNTSSLPEVGGDAVLYVSPNNIEEYINALDSLVTSPTLRETLITNGYERSKLFTWDAVAHKAVDAWKMLV